MKGECLELRLTRQAEPMTILGTWKVTVTRRDGSEHRYTEHRGRAPELHEVLEIRDATGQPMLARIDSIHNEPPKQTGLDIWQISATEI